MRMKNACDSYAPSHSMNLSLSYEVQYQNSNSSFCAGTSCGSNPVRHLVSIGFD